MENEYAMEWNKERALHEHLGDDKVLRNVGKIYCVYWNMFYILEILKMA